MQTFKVIFSVVLTLYPLIIRANSYHTCEKIVPKWGTSRSVSTKSRTFRHQVLLGSQWDCNNDTKKNGRNEQKTLKGKRLNCLWTDRHVSHVKPTSIPRKWHKTYRYNIIRRARYQTKWRCNIREILKRVSAEFSYTGANSESTCISFVFHIWFCAWD